ncbi:MAG TPA: zf-TFIIB domain-containing protein [Anaerolineales bacterium]|nr:zf-TFIIB domain-containing protein [Anaerolineales bacterium]
MNCPKDGTELKHKERHGVEVDSCESCRGIWLDYSELDAIEDTVFAEDDLKGSMIFAKSPTEYKCPICGSPLSQFRYRLHDLTLEYCPNLHGFWLDAEEEERVLDLLREREKDLGRKFKAEAEWSNAIRRLRSPSFAEKIRNLLK